MRSLLCSFNRDFLFEKYHFTGFKYRVYCHKILIFCSIIKKAVPQKATQPKVYLSVKFHLAVIHIVQNKHK